LTSTQSVGFIRKLTDDAGKPTDWVLVKRNDIESDIDPEMNRVNLVTHESVRYHLDLPSGTLVRQAVDRHGDVRVVQMSDTKFWSDVTRLSTWYRTGENAAWTKVEEHSINEDGFTPLLVPDRPNRIVVEAYNGGDHLSVWDYDVDKHAYADQLLASKSGDVWIPKSAAAPGEFTGLFVDGLKRTFVWLDARMNALQVAVDAALPGSVNVLTSSPSGPVLIHSYSDVDESILMDGVDVARHCKIRRAIIDKGVKLPAGTTIGYDLEADRQRFTVTDSGVVVVSKGAEIEETAFVPTDPFYGAFALETSAYARVTDWPTDVVGIHGTNRPELLGQAVSHGCIRVQNDVARRLERLAPLGTPIDIVP